MKKIAILGSTGSIGTQTLEVVENNGDIQVEALSANGNVDLLEKQARKFKPSVIAVFREDAAKELKERLKDMNIRIVTGMDGLIEIATLPETDILVTAIVGMIGILPTIEAIKAGKPVYVAADSMVNDGGLATVGVNYTNLGTQTADMLLKVLTGTPVCEVPVEVLKENAVVVNEETAAAIGVDVSKYAR